MAGRGVCLDAKMLKYAPCTEADRPNGRLGNAGVAQLLFVLSLCFFAEYGNGVNAVGKPLTCVVCKTGVGVRQCVVALRELADQVAEHAHVLRALAGEDNTQLARI